MFLQVAPRMITAALNGLAVRDLEGHLGHGDGFGSGCSLRNYNALHKLGEHLEQQLLVGIGSTKEVARNSMGLYEIS